MESDLAGTLALYGSIGTKKLKEMAKAPAPPQGEVPLGPGFMGSWDGLEVPLSELPKVSHWDRVLPFGQGSDWLAVGFMDSPNGAGEKEK